MGAVLDKVGKVGGVYPVSGYGWTFFASLIATIIAFIAILFMKETFPRPNLQHKGAPPSA
jgi:hypothetical protein